MTTKQPAPSKAPTMREAIALLVEEKRARIEANSGQHFDDPLWRKQIAPSLVAGILERIEPLAHLPSIRVDFSGVSVSVSKPKKTIRVRRPDGSVTTLEFDETAGSE